MWLLFACIDYFKAMERLIMENEQLNVVHDVIYKEFMGEKIVSKVLNKISII